MSSPINMSYSVSPSLGSQSGPWSDARSSGMQNGYPMCQTGSQTSDSSYTSSTGSDNSGVQYSSGPVAQMGVPNYSGPLYDFPPPGCLPISTSRPYPTQLDSSALGGSFNEVANYPSAAGFQTDGTSDASSPLEPDVQPYAKAVGSLERNGETIYGCLWPGCASKAKPRRKTDLTRHIRSMHHGEFVYCEFPDCNRSQKRDGKPFKSVRKDHYNEHLRKRHGVPIPKKTRSGSGSVVRSH